MVGTIITIGTIGILGAVSESLVKNERTKEIIKYGSFGIGGALAIGLIVHTVKELVIKTL